MEMKKIGFSTESMMTLVVALGVGILIYHFLGPYMFAILALIIFIFYKIIEFKNSIDQSFENALEDDDEDEGDFYESDDDEKNDVDELMEEININSQVIDKYISHLLSQVEELKSAKAIIVDKEQQSTPSPEPTTE